MTYTLLVLEDDEDLRDLLCEALEHEGYSVIPAGDGREAFAALARSPTLPNLVLLDLLMPGMNGWDFFAAFRARAELAAVPIVVHTSAPNQAPRGADRVLEKPVAFERLLSVVREYCGN